MKFRRSWLALARVLGCSLAQAATPFSAAVTAAGTDGNGSIYIFLSTPINEPGCTGTGQTGRIDVASTHPQLKQILAIAMAAEVSGQNVYGQVVGCDPAHNTPTFDTSCNSYIYLN